jgi:rSAM/selenodomain-associated transferase 1
MTKAPLAGKVKTRLVPPLTAEEAAELNKNFLRDTARTIMQAIAGQGARGVAVYTPVGAEFAYAGVLPKCFRFLPQRGKTFGTRLLLAASDLFRCGFASLCLIDSDSPTIPASSFSEAIRQLKHSGDRVVLGPCEDGGYYLIGLKALHRELFQRIDWSTGHVFEQTLQRAAEAGLEVKILPQGYDVDDAAGLHRLCDELLRKRANDDIAPHTRKFLKALRPEIRPSAPH